MTSNFCKTSWHPYGHTPEECPDCPRCHESKIPKKLSNKVGVKLSSTLAGQRELIREMRNKINELIDVVRQHRIDFLTSSGFDRDELNELLGEEASKGGCKGDNITLDELKESTRGWGECPATKLFSAWATTEEQRKKWDDMAVKHLKKNCACHSPQQEECPKCGKKMEGMYCCDLSKEEALDILKDVEPEESRGECTCKSYETVDIGCEVCHPELKPDNKFCWKHGVVGIRYGKDGCTHNPQLKEESPKEDEQDWTHDFYETVSKLSILTSDKQIVYDYIKANFVLKVKLKREIDKLQKSCYEADGVIDGITALHHLREKL